MTMTDAPDVIAETFGPGDTDGEESAAQPVRRALSSFEGLAVVGCSIELPSAAGGLREALRVDPVEFHHGDEFHVTFKCKVRKVRFDPVDKDEPDSDQHRVHVADVVQATLVDEELVRDALSSQADRIAQAKEIAGQLKLDAGEQTQEADNDDADPEEPFLGYSDLTTGEVVARIEASGDDDQDLVDAIEAYEEANGGRADILHAVKAWRDQGE